MILFQYYFVFAKVYALFTLHITDWGSRPTVAKSKISCCNEEMVPPATIPHISSIVTLQQGDDIEHHRNGSSSHVFSTCHLDLSENETTITKGKKFVPWYRRPAVVIGSVILGILITVLVELGIRAAQHNVTYWELTVINSQKSLTSDRATGVGLYDRVAEKTFITYAGPNMDVSSTCLVVFLFCVTVQFPL